MFTVDCIVFWWTMYRATLELQMMDRKHPLMDHLKRQEVPSGCVVAWIMPYVFSCIYRIVTLQMTCFVVISRRKKRVK